MKSLFENDIKYPKMKTKGKKGIVKAATCA